MNKERLLKQLEESWAELKESSAGPPESQIEEPGVTGLWTVKEILAHVTTWEEEALKVLPLILEGGRPPRYSSLYGGINAFNAVMTQQKRGLSLAAVMKDLDDTHRRLVGYVLSAPEEQITRETRFRRRLRLDTYGHYRIHARSIRQWRERQIVG